MSKIKEHILENWTIEFIDMEEGSLSSTSSIESIEELVMPSKTITVEKIDFGWDLDTSETTKEKLKRLYNEMAVENWFNDIEHFYVKMKFKLAMKGSQYSKADDYLSNLLKTIAMDLWYGSSNKEVIMQNTLPSVSWSDLIGR